MQLNMTPAAKPAEVVSSIKISLVVLGEKDKGSPKIAMENIGSMIQVEILNWSEV